jgi:hypothetical protein
LCALARGCYHGLCAERVVEPHLLILKSLLSLVELVEASTLALTITLVLQGFLTSRGVEQSGLTFNGALIEVGGVDRVGLMLEDEALIPRVVGRRRLLAKSALSALPQLA